MCVVTDKKSSPEKLAYMRQYQIKNRDRLNAEDREKYYKNREYHLQYAKQYRKNNRELLTEKQRIYYKLNKERISEYERIRHRKKGQDMKLKVFQLLGNKCARCGLTDERVFQLDHVNGDGAHYRENRHRRRAYIIYESILSGEERLIDHQILCANCHMIKTLEEREYVIRRAYLPSLSSPKRR